MLDNRGGWEEEGLALLVLEIRGVLWEVRLREGAAFFFFLFFFSEACLDAVMDDGGFSSWFLELEEFFSGRGERRKK